MISAKETKQTNKQSNLLTLSVSCEKKSRWIRSKNKILSKTKKKENRKKPKKTKNENKKTKQKHNNSTGKSVNMKMIIIIVIFIIIRLLITEITVMRSNNNKQSDRLKKKYILTWTRNWSSVNANNTFYLRLQALQKKQFKTTARREK